MATLRIAIESGDAVRGANAAKDALRALGQQALQSERDVVISAEEMQEALGDLAVPDLDFSKLAAEAQQLKAGLAQRQSEDAFATQLEAPTVARFGGNLAQSGLFSQAELGGTVEGLRLAREEAARAQAEMSRLGLDLERIGAVAPSVFAASAAGAANLAAQTIGASDASRELFSLQADPASIREAEAEVSRLGTSLETIGTVAPSAFGRATVGAVELEAATRGAVAAQEQLLGLGSIQGQAARLAPQALSGATSLGGATTIDSRGADIIAAQERAYVGARAAAASYGTTVERSVGGATSALGVNLSTLARVGGAILGVRGITAGLDSLISYEQGLVGVSQATGAFGDELEDLSRRIIGISTSGLPVVTQDLLQFAESAGRLQIRSPEGVEQFVRDMALLRTIAPDLGGAASEAGDAVGRLLKLSGESPANVGQLADVVARLDDEFGASGATIFDTGEQIAKAGQDSIRSSADVLGLGAAFAALGVDGAAGGQAVAQVMTVVRDAVQRGGQEIRTLAEVTGLSVEQIQQSFRTDGASLFITVLEGLSRQGDESAQAMDDLGLASARQARSLGPLIANTDELRRGLRLARDAQIQGGDAARDAGQAQDTLGAKIASTRNLFTAAVGANGALVTSLGAVVDVGNAVAANLLGVEQGADGAGKAAQFAADGLTAAAVAGTGALVVARLAAGYRLLSAELVVTKTAVDLYTGATVVSATATTGLAAAATRAGAALTGFIASPLGIAVAAGAAVAGIAALVRWLDDVDGDPAAEELDKVIDRMAGLDRAAAGLRDARDIIFKADLTGDAEAKAQGLQARLRELEGAATVIAGEVRLNVEDVEPQFRAAFQGLGGDLGGKDIEQRLNAALAASVAALEIPRLPPERAAALQESLAEAFAGVPPETVARLRASVAEAVSAAQIPAGKLEALKVDELFPDVQGAGLNFRSAVEDAVLDARSIAQEAADASISNARASAVAGGGFAIPTINVEEAFPASLGKALEDKVGDLFGPELGNRAKGALEAALAGAVEGIDPEALKIDLGALSSGEIDDEGVERLAATLEKAGASGIGAAAALRAVDAAIEQTRAQIDAVEFKEPTTRPSDFYIDEAQRIRAATDDAELAIGRLSPRETVRQSGAETEVLSSSQDLTGIDARREALVREREEYEETLRARVAAQDQSERISEAEAASLSALADGYFEARDAALLFGEAQRRLGAEQELLGTRIDLLGRQLQVLGLNAQDETAQAFAIMRERIELAREAAEKGLQIKVNEGEIQPDEVAAIEKQIDATYRLSLAEQERRELLVENRRAIDNLAAASGSFASNTFDALVGLQEPLEALKNFALDLAGQFIEPQLQAGFLDLFAPDKLKGEAKRRAGVEDLGVQPGPIELPEVPDLALSQAAEAQPLSEISASALAAGAPLDSVAAAATAAAAGLEGVGPAGATAGAGAEHMGAAGHQAAGGAEHLAGAAELAAQALESLAGRGALGAVESVAEPLADRLDLPVAAAGAEAFQAAAGGLELPTPGASALEPGRASFESALAGLPGVGAPSGQEPARGGLPSIAASSVGREAFQEAASGVQDALEPVADRLAIGARAPAAAQQRPSPAAGVAQGLPIAGDAPRDLAGLAPRQAARAPSDLELPGRSASAASKSVEDLEFGGLDALDDGATDAARATSAAAESMGDLGPAVVDVAEPLRKLGPGDLLGGGGGDEELAQARTAVSRQGFAVGADVAAGSAGGAFPIGDEVDVALAPLRQAGDEVAVGMGAAAASSEIAATGLTSTGISSELAAVGLTTAQVAAVSVSSSFFAATQAAAAYAAQVGAKVATSFIPGAAPLGSAYGNAFGQGAPRFLADGDVVGKMSDLEGQVVRSPRFVIGEGTDPEAVMPLDNSGGVRGIGASGERVSLTLARDGSGKLGVRVPDASRDEVERFAMGGVPGYDTTRRSQSLQVASIPQRSAAEQSSLSIGVDKPASTTTNNSTEDNSNRSMQFVSHYHFHGNATPDAGFRRSARQHEQDMRDRTRNVLKGRSR